MVAERIAENYISGSGHQFQEGQKINFNLHSLNPDGSVVCENKLIEIERVAGGGFFGQVLIAKDQPLVVKTALPDSWHHLWRLVNWGFRPFPAQYSEVAAKLNHTSMSLIHDALGPISDGKYSAPASLGWTRFSSGYAQVIEKLDARAARFDSAADEFSFLREAQQELTRIGYRLGLESVARISAIPVLGSHLAIPAMVELSVARSDKLWHYNVRNFLAGFSTLNPAGGWGTQLEAELWQHLGKKMQGWVKTD